jgi:hypothetical protein
MTLAMTLDAKTSGVFVAGISGARSKTTPGVGVIKLTGDRSTLGDCSGLIAIDGLRWAPSHDAKRLCSSRLQQ